MSHLGRREAAALAVVVAVLVAAGCGGSRSASGTTSSAAPAAGAGTTTSASATPPLTVTSHRCVAVPAALTRRILAHVVLVGAHLDHVRAYATPDDPGYFFVSSRVTAPSSHRQQLATWAANGLEGRGAIYAVDSFAALISTYGAGQTLDPALTITAPAAYHSRVCVAGPGAPHGAPAPATSGPGNPATG